MEAWDKYKSKAWDNFKKTDLYKHCITAMETKQMKQPAMDAILKTAFDEGCTAVLNKLVEL